MAYLEIVMTLSFTLLLTSILLGPIPNDIMIELWHHGGHWSLKKSGNQYLYRSTNGTEWKADCHQE